MDFPFADAPSIIRAHQKDKYVENDMFIRIKDCIQSLKGVRFTHNWTSQIKALTTLLYLGLTTLSGSRTLGEEYTDLFYVTNKRRLPSKLKLILYVFVSGLSPLVVPKIFEKLRAVLLNFRNLLKKKASKSEKPTNITGYEDEDEDEGEDLGVIDEYVSPATLISLNLALFYLTGAYYQISKRLFGLRYVFGYRVDKLSQSTASYEIIGVLMVIRTVFNLFKKIKEQLPKENEEEVINPKEMGKSLADPEVLPFIEGNSRNCHLCYEEMRAPTVTLCGHVYCWSCISDWCRDQKFCPLCRQECYEQHLLNLRV